MRISTKMLFETGSGRISDLQATLARAQDQIATGRRILTPSDDPVAAARALELSQARSINAQLATNRDAARHNLNMQEVALQDVTKLIQDVQAMVVQGGNGSLDNQQRSFLATELRGRMEDLLGLANTDDGTGNYLFAGYQVTTKPYASEAGSITYKGDQGQRMLQVGPQRTIALSEPGSTVFEGAKTGNGYFNAVPAGTNTGGGEIVLGSNGRNEALATSYELRFAIDPDTEEVTFTVHDLNAADPDVPIDATPRPYVSGQSIDINGYRVEIKGAPADGDSFVLEPSRRQSLFKTMENLIAALEAPVDAGAGRAALANGLNEASRSLANALDSILTTRASIGSRMRELDNLDSQGEDRDLQYATTLAELQELDYTKAISDMVKQKIILDAAQQSFVQTSQLSLFNYL